MKKRDKISMKRIRSLKKRCQAPLGMCLGILGILFCLSVCGGAAGFSDGPSADGGTEVPVGKERDPHPTGSAPLPRILVPLEGEEPERARRLAAGSVVRLDILGEHGEYYGSGVIWDTNGDDLILATAGHLLEKGQIARIVFADGERQGTYLTAISTVADVGFVEIPWQDADVPAVPSSPGDAALAVTALHQRIFDTLDGNSPLSVIACTQEGRGDILCEGYLVERAWFREEFGTDVMILDCRSREGMSGAGVFDGYGDLVGIVLGGNDKETAVLSMEKVNEAYGEIYGRHRETDRYRKVPAPTVDNRQKTEQNKRKSDPPGYLCERCRRQRGIS